MFARNRRYDRARLLAEATRARQKGKAQKAVALYREILGAEPGNVDVHRRLAPLLARTRRHEEAWTSYRRAAEGLEQQGFVERAIGVYREAAHHMPRESAAWLAIAELELKRGRRADAVEALTLGARTLRSRKERPQALRLLERAHELDPGAFEVSFELAGRLAQAGKRERALKLLDTLAVNRNGRLLRRVRGRQVYLAPGPRNAWRWIQALAS